MKNFFLFVLLILIFATAYLWWNRAKILSNYLSREIGGVVQIKDISVSLSSVTFKNVEVVDSNELTTLRVARLTIKAYLPKLIQNPSQISAIEFDNGELKMLPITVDASAVDTTIKHVENLFGKTKSFFSKSKKKPKKSLKKTSARKFIVERLSIDHFKVIIPKKLGSKKTKTFDIPHLELENINSRNPVTLDHLFETIPKVLQDSVFEKEKTGS